MPSASSTPRSSETPDRAQSAGVPTADRARRIGAIVAIALVLLGAAGFAGLDRAIYDLTLNYTNTPDPLDRDFWVRTRPAWETVRLFGSIVGGVAALFYVAIFHPRSWPMAIRSLAAVGAADLATAGLQFLLGRVRPNRSPNPLDFRSLPGLSGPDGDAVGCFPSGEATAAFALAIVLSRLYPRWTAFFFIVASLNALARVVQGSHYLSDVCAGMLVGAGVAAAVFEWLERRSERLDGAMLQLAARLIGPRSPR